MKASTKAFIFLVIACLLGAGIYSVNRLISVKKALHSKIQRRPDLSQVRFIQNGKLVQQALTEKPTLLILFNSGCEHCQAEATQIHKRYREFAAANVVMLTSESLQDAQSFVQHFGLDSLGMISVGTLSADQVYNAFGHTSFPHLYLYGPDGNLRNEYQGETKIDALLAALK